MKHNEKNPLLPDPSEEAVEVQQQYVKGLLNRLTQKPKTVKGACKKCGFSGHLTFQCMNFISVTPVASKKVEPVSIAKRVSSSDESGEYNSEKEDKKRKRIGPLEGDRKRAKRDSSTEERHTEKKKLKKESKKLKKRRKNTNYKKGTEY